MNDSVCGTFFFIIVLAFLFAGEPDAWDKLHAYVMSLQPVAACTK